MVFEANRKGKWGRKTVFSGKDGRVRPQGSGFQDPRRGPQRFCPVAPARCGRETVCLPRPADAPGGAPEPHGAHAPGYIWPEAGALPAPRPCRAGSALRPPAWRRLKAAAESQPLQPSGSRCPAAGARQAACRVVLCHRQPCARTARRQAQTGPSARDACNRLPGDGLQTGRKGRDGRRPARRGAKRGGECARAPCQGGGDAGAVSRAVPRASRPCRGTASTTGTSRCRRAARSRG